MAQQTSKPKQLEIAIYDVIGESYWGEKTVSAKDVLRQLSGETFDEIVVRINTVGGDAFHSFSIYNLLARREERVIVEIDGLAASGGSIVAMAGDEIRMAANSMMMIHDAWTIVVGNKQDIREASDFLAKLDAQLVKTYAARSKGDGATIARQMSAETWFTAEEAKAAGLCDVIISAKEANARFDLSAFKNVPKAAAERFGKADTRHFSIALGPMRFEQLFPKNEEEKPMSKATEPTKTEEQQATPPAANQQPPVPTAADVAKAKDEGAAAAKAAEKERSSKIIALCKQAGKPDQAGPFIEADLSVADVQAKLFESMCAERKPVGEEGGDTIVAPKADADAEAKKEYKANPHLAAVMTEEEFIAQKKRDEDHGYVMPKSVAAALAGAN